MTTAELGCDIDNIQILESGVRPALRERKIQRSLYLTAQLTVFVFAQDKWLPCADRAKASPQGKKRAWGASPAGRASRARRRTGSFESSGLQ